MNNKPNQSKILLFGAGGHASKIVQIAQTRGMDIIGYISTESPGSLINGIAVLGDLEYFKENQTLHDIPAHIAIGEISVRSGLFREINELSRLVSVISPNVFISHDAKIGEATCILQNVVIQTNVRIGKSCIIDTGAIIEHDVVIGNFANISPGAILCGNVRTGNGVIVGAGATIIECVSIGDNTLIGAGAVVTDHIGANCVAVGNPARTIKKRKFSDRYLRGSKK